MALAWAPAASANPTGAQVAAGAAGFSTAGKTLTVTNTPGTIINWQSFSIGAGSTTHFQQQSALSAVLNRVIGGDPSQILGTLSSNGRVFLVNPHGIVFGQGSVINTAGLVASTLNIRDEDFLAGRMKFEGGGLGALKNEGTLRASGDIFLVGPQIENAGLIKSENGSVVLAAGKSLTISSPDAHGVQFALQAPTDAALNLGAIEAKNAASMFAGTLRHSGEIRAVSASVDASGRVTLAAQKDAIVDGNSLISVDNLSGRGGRVEITGERVGLFDNATVSARGAAGGGEILVGGDYQGANPAVRNAGRTFVGNSVSLDASASNAGDGGKIIVWADEVTRYFGNAAVRGGALGGDGGLVEVSGKNALVFDGRVGLEAVNGRAGTLLLDPLNITVHAGTGTLDGFLSSPGDPLLAFGEPDNVTPGTLNVATLQAFTTGTVELQANNNITFDAAVTMQSGVSLKAAAMNNINVNANITTSGGGVLRLEADTDASGAGVVNLGSVTINAPLIAGDTGKEFSGKVVIGGNVTFGENAEAFGKLTYATGSLSVASGKTLTLKGGMDWATTNTISGPGAITLPTGQTLALTVSGNHALSGMTFNNNGTVTTSIGGGNVLVNDSAVVNNAGVFRLGDIISVNSGTGTFNNTGTLEVNGSGTATVNSVTLNNTGGTLNSALGTLNINASGNHSGALNITGTNVRLTAGTHSFADSSTIAGQLNVAGGTASFGTVAANGLVNYTGGGFNITAGDTLTLNAGMNWATTNTISGPGAITLPTGQTLALTVSGNHALSGMTFNNNGTVTTSIGGGNVLVNDSAVVNNAGVFRLGDIISVNSGTGTFNNTGTLEVNGSGTATVNSVTLNNTGGTLNSALGTLNINASGNHSGALNISGGNVRLTAGTHSFADSTTIAGQLNVAGGTASFGTVTANGLVNYTGGGFNVTAGDTLTLNAGMNWSEGFSITGPGTVTLPAGQTLATAGGGGDRTLTNVTFNNNGTFDSGSNGNVLVNDGSVFNNAGLYRFLNAGNFISRNSGAGTFNNTGTTRVGGAFTNNINNVTFTNTGGTLDSGTGTLNLNSGGSHSGSLTMQGTGVVLAGGTHNFADATTVAGRLNVSGGTASFGTVTTSGLVTYGGGGFNVTTADTLTLNGGMNWTSGDIGGPGTIVLPAGQTLAMSTAGNRAMVNLVFNNNGTVTSQIGAQHLINDGSVFNNAGVYRFLDSSAINRNSGAGTFNNTGEIEVVGAFNGFVSGVTLTNTGGTLDSGTGSLRLDASGNHSGALTLQGGNVQLNAGTHNFADGTTVAGTLNVQGSATASFGTVTMNGPVNYSNGGFNVTAGDTLTLNGGMNWTGAGINGPGTITLPAGQTLAISVGGGNPFNNITFNNNGTTTFQIGSGSLLINDGSVFNNAGVFRFLSAASINRNSGAGTFNNTGEIEVGGAFAGTVQNVTFNNTAGTLDSGTGTLDLNGGSYAGAMTLQGGNVRLNTGTHTFADGTTIAGQLNVAGGTTGFGTVTANGLVNFTGGSINVTAGDTLTLNSGMNWSSNLGISGPGTITLPAGRTVAMTGNFDHALSNVTFNNNGTVTSQIGGASLLINDNSVFNNNGVYRFLGGDLISRNSGTGTFNNNGEIEVGGAFTATFNNGAFFNAGGTLDSGAGTLNLNSGGTYTGNLTLDGANVRMNAGTHNIADGVTITGILNVTGGTASFGSVTANGLVNYVSGGFNVTTGDTLMLNAGINWSSNIGISGPGAITLPAGQIMAMTGNFDHALSNVTFNNNGTVTSQIGGASLLINDSSVFNNNGIYRFQGGDVISRNSGPGTFNNTGEMEVGGAFTANFNNVAFFNTGGTIDGGAGTLNLNAGGTYTGNLTVGGANVRMNAGTHSLADGVTVNGILNVTGGTASFGSVTANGLVNYSAGGFNVTAGDTLTLNAGMNWSSNTGISGPGAIALSAGQTLAMTGNFDHALSNVTFNNNGTVTSQIGANLLINDSSVFNNAGVYRFLSGDIISRNSGAGTFNNTGEIEVGGAFIGAVNNLAFFNAGGTLDGGAGTLNLNAGGTYTGNLTVGGANVRMSAGTHSLADGVTVNGILNVTGGTASFGTVAANGLVNYSGGGFNVTAGDTLTLNGGMNWTAGANISGPGAITLAGGQTMAMTVAASRGLVNATFNNNGTVTSQIGGESMFINDGSVFNNAGVYRFLGSDTINRNSGVGTLNNSGTLEVGGAFTGTVNNVTFNNTGGTLDSGAGTLNLNAGGSHSGVMTVEGANVRFAAGTHTFNTASFAGAGAIKVQGAALVFSDTTWNRSLNFTSGSVDVAAATTTTIPAAANVVINHAVGGTGTLLNQGTLELAGSNVQGNLSNEGTLNILGLSTVFGSRLDLISGALNVTGGHTLQKTGGSIFWTGGSINGAGTITGPFAFDGAGARVLQGPTLNVSGAGIGGGSLLVNAGSVNYAGPATIAAAATVELVGGDFSSGGGLDVFGLLKIGSRTVTAPNVVLHPGGELTGRGQITGTLANNGTLSPGLSPGTLTINGNYVQGAAGVLNIELGGTTQGVNYDWLEVIGTATLAGTLNVTAFGSFAGTAGDLFGVMTYLGVAGDFTTRNLIPGAVMTASPLPSTYLLTLNTPATVAGLGSAAELAIIKLPASETQILNEKFLGTVIADAGKPPEDEEKKGTVLECR
ncbi:MAG: filamentous hemagglutinin N-terminal domain-containing protein [Burkholderiales bacterium]|nr:filamentous hemagglutinin N-terminal domain-containing protein [Burkholderiales bacterium]